MDLQTRKLNLIAYLTQIKDEVFFDKLESFILKKESIQIDEIKPFTIDQLITRIEKSELDFENNKVQSQEDLEELSEKW